MATIFIIENYPLTRQGISLILDQEPDLTVCGQAGDAESVLEALEALNPDLAIVELAVPGMIGLDLNDDAHPATPPTVHVQSWIEEVPSIFIVLSGSRV